MFHVKQHRPRAQ